MHENDRKRLADQLGLSLSTFYALVQSANHAYEIIKKLGPFYGKEDITEPTFRITAEPVLLPKKEEQLLTQLGNDLFLLGKAASRLPSHYKERLGEFVDFRLPPTWRIDAILDESKHLRVNEVEGVDGASGLMIVEQL